MKKKFILLLTIMCLFGGGVNFSHLNAQETVEIGLDGTGTSTNIPIVQNTLFSISQLIYHESDFNGLTGVIEKVAFKCVSGNTTRNLEIYIKSTVTTNYTSSLFPSAEVVTSQDRFYSGQVTVSSEGDGWVEITLDNPYVYEGGNILVCVNDKTGSNAQYSFATYSPGVQRAIYNYRTSIGSVAFDPSTSITRCTRLSSLNQIKFTFAKGEPGVEATPEIVEIGTARLGNYWSENTPSQELQLKTTDVTITSITSDNSFFTIPSGLDYTQNPLTFEVGYNKNGEAGEQEGTISVNYTLTDNTTATKEIPASATAYNPVSGDVFELAENVTFSNGAYTHTPVFANLYDDYNMPGEAAGANTKDAAYKIVLTEDAIIEANLSGTNANIAMYKEFGEGEGPSADNNYSGTEVPGEGGGEGGEGAVGTVFAYDFSEGTSFNIAAHFTLIDNDGDGKNWYAEVSNDLRSSSYGSGVGAETDNIIMTKEPFDICTNTFLSFKALRSRDNKDILKILVSQDGRTFNEVATMDNLPNNYQVDPFEFSLGEYSGEYYIALQHIGTQAGWYVYVDDLKLENKATKSNTRANSMRAQFPAGTYYLIAAAEDAFSLNLKKSSAPTPTAATLTSPANDAREQVNPLLTWQFGDYTSEYKVLFGTTNPPTGVVVDWTSTLATSYQTENLQNHTQYFWQILSKNTTGEVSSDVFSFVTPLNKPTNVQASATELHPGETTTISWTAAQGAASYNVYVGDTKFNANPITGTSFELSDIPYNMTGNAVTVTAVFNDFGESAKSEAVSVKMSGQFPLVLNVKDSNGNPIAGATVKINTDNAYDEYKVLVNPVADITTDANGQANVTLPLLQASYYSYNSYSWVYPSYSVTVSKSNYVEFAQVISDSEIENNVEFVLEAVLDLVKPENLTASVGDGCYLGEDIVLNWDAVNAASSYNVYVNGELEGTAETNTYTISSQELGYSREGHEISVSASYAGLGESPKSDVITVKVTGYGTISGLVNDGTAPIAGASVTVEIKGTDEIGGTVAAVNTTTDAEGNFTATVPVGTYTVSVTRYDYKDVVSEAVVTYNATTDITLSMTANQAAVFAVTATDGGNVANVTWTTNEYTKFNVYRKDATGTVEKIASDITAKQYQDTDWSALDEGIYQYGVSAIVGNVSNYTEGFEGGTMPEGWSISSNNTVYYNPDKNWEVSKTYNGYAPSSGSSYAAYSKTNRVNAPSYKYYLITPQIDLTSVSSPSISFDYRNPDWYQNNGQYANDFYVYVSTSYTGTGPWEDEEDENIIFKSITNGNIEWENSDAVSLKDYEGQKVYIAFCVNMYYSYCTAIDNVVYPVGSVSESKINWSNEIEKKASIVFNNADGDNDWSNAANWSTGVVPGENDDVVINAAATISSTLTVKSLTIGEGSLTLANNAVLTVNGELVNTVAANLVINDGAQLYQNSENVQATFNMNVFNPEEWSTENQTGWQFIGSPFAEETAAISGFVGDDAEVYDLYKYDGSRDYEWVNYKTENPATPFENTFVSSVGYLFSHKDKATMQMTGTLNTANPFSYIYNGVWYGYQYAGDLSEKDLANFYLFSNPFTYDIEWSDFELSGTIDGFATIDSDGSYSYGIDGDVIPVGDGFFVKANGNWPTMNYNPNSNAKSTRERVESLSLVATGTAGSDNVVITFAGSDKAGFNKLQNLNDAIANIYVMNGGVRCGIGNYDRDVREVEVAFEAKEMGNYTIAAQPNGKFNEIILVDRMTGTETDLLMEDYGFTATSRDNHNRFLVRFSMSEAQAETAEDSFVYQSGEELVVNAEGAVQIIDVMGRIVYSSEVSSDSNRINVSLFDNAAYIVRLVNENGVKTQKVVIF